ncbi:MAG: hypothetical protein HPY66_0529 [Firmicutes bacterium]|nr:hypothetical protein [Bacillota bacterium]
MTTGTHRLHYADDQTKQPTISTVGCFVRITFIDTPLENIE